MMKQNRKQPWNQTFSNVRDSSGHLSRTKLHHQDHNNNVITAILLIIIGLIAVFALIYGLASNTFGHDNNSHRAETRVSRVSHPHKHHKKRNKQIHNGIERPSISTTGNTRSVRNNQPVGQPIHDSTAKINKNSNKNSRSSSSIKSKSIDDSKDTNNSGNISRPSTQKSRTSTPRSIQHNNKIIKNN